MKKLTLSGFVILFSLMLTAQTNFFVPELTDLQKFQVANSLCMNNIIMAISYEKANGRTYEDYGKFGAEMIIPFFKETGFENFVKDQLYVWSAMSEKTVILSQSENKIIFAASKFFPELEAQGQIWNVSYTEVIKWLEMLYGIPCSTIGISYSMNITDRGVEITIAKL